MKAAQLVEPGRMEMVEAPILAPGERQVLVKSHRASICGSDIHIVFDGYHQGEYPAAPGYSGHEGIGQVEESRSGTFAPGEWVLAVPSPPDARTFGDFHVVAEESLITLPTNGDMDKLLMAQQLGTVVFSFRRHWPESMDASGKTVAICGAGSAGLFFTQLVRRAGFERVIVADKASLRLDIAKRFGADVLVDVGERSFVDTVLEETSGVGADLVIEAVGFDETRVQCLDAVRFGGRIGYFGFPETPSGPSTWSFAEAWRKTPSIEVVNGTQREPGLRSFHEAIGLIHSGEIDVDPFLEPVYPLEKIQEAFEAARGQRGGKIAIQLGV